MMRDSKAILKVEGEYLRSSIDVRAFVVASRTESHEDNHLVASRRKNSLTQRTKLNTKHALSLRQEM